MRNKNGNKYFFVTMLLRFRFSFARFLSGGGYLCHQFLKIMHSSGGNSGNIRCGNICSRNSQLCRSWVNHSAGWRLNASSLRFLDECERFSLKSQTRKKLSSTPLMLMTCLKTKDVTFNLLHSRNILKKCFYGIGSSLSYSSFVQNLSASNNLK